MIAVEKRFVGLESGRAQEPQLESNGSLEGSRRVRFIDVDSEQACGSS